MEGRTWKTYRHRVGQKPPWSTSLKAAVPWYIYMYLYGHSIPFLHSAACKCRPNILKLNTAMTSSAFLTQVLLSDTHLLSDPLGGVTRVPLCRKPSCWERFYREPSASPKRIFCPALSWNLKSLGASKISTIVEPKLNSPKCSPFLMGIPSLLLLDMKLKSL